ncbi:MAG: hypothetical protein J6C10_04335 [Prevotella sp.]|nr:hypothetical protein [Prevotella sp.]
MQIRQRTNWLQKAKGKARLSRTAAAAGIRASAKRLRASAALACLAAAAFTACEQDTYEKGDGYFSDTQATFCEAHSNSSKAIDYVMTDDGDYLPLTVPFTSKAITTPDSLYRMAIYYNKLKQGKAEVVSLSMVPTMGIADAAEFENLATDPVKLESAWVSLTGKYVNLALWLKVGVAGEGAEKQSLGMVRTDSRTNADGTTTAILRLHHSQGEVPEHYSQKYYVSLLTKQIDADSLCLLVNTYDGEVKKLMRIR